MTSFRCLIVDDEPIEREIIERYCAQLPYLEVCASVKNAIEENMVLQNERVDILFLDINMPVIDGLSFMKSLKHPPQVIFTTAYKEFAVDAFDLTACDYLLKPFSLERFMAATGKAIEKLRNVPASPVSTTAPAADNFFFIRTDGKIYKIQHDQLLYAEASGNYTKLFTVTGMLMPAMTFSNIEELLPATEFARVHRSFIINKAHISHIEGNRVFVGKTEIPIGSNYKENFLKALGISG